MKLPLSLCFLWLAIVAVTLKSSLAQELSPNCSGFATSPMDSVIPRGGTSCLSCTYSGGRRPRWQALLMDQSFSAIPTDRDECDCMVDAEQRLCFDNAGDEAEGEYRCLVQLDGSPNSIYCQFQIELAAPPIASPAENRQVVVGDTATLTVPYQPGNPTGDVTWYKDGSPVTLGGKFSVDSGGALVITNVQPEDRGLYNFTVSNIGGADSTTVGLLVSFVEIVSLEFSSLDGGGIRINCMASGYPIVTISLTDSTSENRIMKDDFHYEVTAQTDIPDLADCNSPYSCTASLESEASATELIRPCSTPMATITGVTLVNTSAVMVRWLSTGADGYTIRYKESGSSDGYQFIEASGSDTEVIINGLTPGLSYLFAISTDAQTYSDSFMFIVEPCDASFTQPIRSVTANTISRDNQQTIQLTWAASTEQDVYGYRVYVMPCSDSVPCSVQIEGQTTINHMLPSAICDGNRYTFFVQSINNCGGGGPNSSLVVRMCDVRNRLTELKANVDYVTVKWSFVESPRALRVSAKRVDQQVTLNYNVEQESFRVESVCIGGLESDSTYEVCLLPEFSTEPNGINEYCDYVTTLTGVASGQDCLLPMSTSIPPSVFLNWHIAIIVVGALAIVAMVFCLVGLCFACQSSKQKVDFGSNSSLNTTYNTNSIREGVSIQRSNSPSRSCLSYHTKGHSTNWSDHVDTLRQMETDGGTHV